MIVARIYGVMALDKGIRFSEVKSRLLIWSVSNPHGFLGSNQPFLAIGIITIKATMLPSREGKSGPNKPAINAEDPAKMKPDKRANFQIANPSRQLLFIPQKRVSITESTSGRMMPGTRFSKAVCAAAVRTKSFRLV